MSTAVLLSTKYRTGFSEISRSSRSPASSDVVFHMAYAMAIYSASTVLSATIFCRRANYAIGAPLNVTKAPEVDRLAVKSVPKYASEYAFSACP